MENHDDPLRSGMKESQTLKYYKLMGYGAGKETYDKSLVVVKEFVGKKWANKYGERLASIYLEEIAGVMSVIVMPPYNARKMGKGEVPYPKAAAGEMLARTDFASIIKQLSLPVYHYIQEADLWETMLLQTINALAITYIYEPITREDRVFPSGSIAPHGTTEVELSIKLKDWLPKLVGLYPEDRLTEANYPQEKGEKQEGSWLESMGKFGSKMDAGHTTDDKPRPIFEFRKMLRLKNTELLDVTVGIWEMVNAAHGRA